MTGTEALINSIVPPNPQCVSPALIAGCASN